MAETLQVEEEDIRQLVAMEKAINLLNRSGSQYVVLTTEERRLLQLFQQMTEEDCHLFIEIAERIVK